MDYNDIEIRPARFSKGVTRTAEITFNTQPFPDDEWVGKQIRPCVFRPTDKLQDLLTDRLGEPKDTEFEIFNLTRRRVGLDDRQVGWIGQMRWETKPDYFEDWCCL